MNEEVKKILQGYGNFMTGLDADGDVLDIGGAARQISHLIDQARQDERKKVYKEIDDMIIGTDAPFEKRMTEGCLVVDMNPVQWQKLTGINWGNKPPVNPVGCGGDS